ncbi:MAG: hypothetical protein OXP66_03255, partial [Candidatus Tectomicrobia bacterium]|nr:hypothetical protein [Candidatus Tectomicrobia bacterium]
MSVKSSVFAGRRKERPGPTETGLPVNAGVPKLLLTSGLRPRATISARATERLPVPDAGAGHARPSPSPPERPEPRRLSPPGALRRAAAAVLVLLAGALLGGLAPETARAQTAQTVTLDWPLIPSGVGAGSSFRLLFVTTSDLLGSHTTVGPYNAIAQGDANAAGVDATIRGMQAEFRALVSTGTVDARDNTATTHTNTNRGVPIYWLGGAKVADDYAD